MSLTQRKERTRGDIVGLEEKVDKYLDIKQQMSALKSQLESLDKEITDEVEPLVLEQERAGQSVLTLRVAASKTGEYVDVVYTNRSKNIDTADVGAIVQKLGHELSKDFLQDDLSITLKGETAKTFLARANDINMYPQFDSNIQIKETTTLCKDFLTRRCESRSDLNEEQQRLLEEVGKEYLYKPTFKTKILKD